MASLSLFLAFFSAATSAIFHAMLKADGDRLALRIWNLLICAACAMPVAIWTGPLPQSQWGVMAGFAIFSAANIFILNYSYRINDFSSAYPVARGVVPLTMAGLGVLILGDRLSPLALAGIAIIAIGIISMALGKAMHPAGWIAAILTGLTTVGYNFFTAKGMREAAEPLNFIAWLYVADCILVPIYFLSQTGSAAASRLRASFARGWPTAAITLLSFTALAYALRLAPIGIVSAIRESSVLIGLVLAAFMLKERLDRWRIGAGLGIVAGAVMLAFA